ncbi:uncharacterized protein LOC111380110 [Olea europaea subsp. europaea]|uniref:Uncharacterized protein LOC111380110 n=1 Tax=Olea europaea subsp. europaea TaxID=158383 RepID=A0A8S0PCA1_OLEEU|nr:uncharacterized protein LOC111380110 [Olea europaea subsp. europaea]
MDASASALKKPSSFAAKSGNVVVSKKKEKFDSDNESSSNEEDVIDKKRNESSDDSGSEDEFSSNEDVGAATNGSVDSETPEYETTKANHVVGNWSTLYYNVSNYTFVAPVLGLLAYDSSTRSPHYDLIELNLMGDNPIVVRFPNVSLSVGMKCVRFSTNGTVQLSNVTGNNSCMARGHGHFSIVVPSRPSDEMTKERVWRWWVIGFAGGIVGLILLLVVVIMVYKLIKGGKIKKMERQSERNEVLDTIWIGRSRMPSASGIRTQPELESSYIP